MNQNGRTHVYYYVLSQLALFEERPKNIPVHLGQAQVRELAKSQILTRPTGRAADFDFTLNPYIGCGFGCSYCFAANFVADEVRKENWGKWIDVKANAVVDLRRKNLTGKSIFMSSATDPYQPLEARVGLTRAILEVLIEKQPKLVIQTRGPLVTRDIDLLKQFRSVRVNMSITTDCDDIRKRFEPSCASIEKRLQALCEVRDAGIRTTICISPMLPMKDAARFAKRVAGMKFGFCVTTPFRFSDRQFAASTRELAIQIAKEYNWSTDAYYHQVKAMSRFLPQLNAGGWHPE